MGVEGEVDPVQRFYAAATLSMRPRAAAHLFVGFDPRRRRCGAAGPGRREPVRMGGRQARPAHGFRPLGNVDDPPKGMTAEEAVGVAGALHRLYEWCPADESSTEFCQPGNWRRCSTDSTTCT
ncbi:MAG: hypothetical protein ACRD1K_06825 [Acidimicrobiales bacterium]